MAVCGRSHPRTGDQRRAEGTPVAKPCGSNTPTGPAGRPRRHRGRQIVRTGCRRDDRSRRVEQHRDHDVVALAASGRSEQDHRVLHRGPALHSTRRTQAVAHIGGNRTSQRRSQCVRPSEKSRRSGCGLHLAAVGEADDCGRVVSRLGALARQEMPRRHRGGDDQREDYTGEGPIQDGRTDWSMPGPARVTAVRERGDASEQIAVWDPVARNPGRGGPGQPKDTDENGADSHGTEKPDRSTRRGAGVGRELSRDLRPPVAGWCRPDTVAWPSGSPIRPFVSPSPRRACARRLVPGRCPAACCPPCARPETRR